MPPFKLTIYLLAFIMLGACSQEPMPVIHIGTNLWPGYEPLYLASDRLDWENKKNIQLIEYPSASEVLRAFRNHSLEAASLTLDEALLLKRDGISIKIIMVHDFSDGADVILAKPSIHNMQQLKGKTIAVESSALGSFFLSRALQINHMSLDDVTIKNVAVNLHAKAWEDGNVDAVVTFEPFRSKLLGQGAIEIFSSKNIPGEIVDVLIVHEDFALKYPQKIRELVDDWFWATKYMQQNHSEAYEFIANRTQAGTSEVALSYKLLHIPSRDENITMLQNDGPIYQSLMLLNDFLFEIGVLHQRVDINGLVDSQYL